MIEFLLRATEQWWNQHAIQSITAKVSNSTNHETSQRCFFFVLRNNRVSSRQRTSPMSLIQLIYASTPFGFDSATLNSILTVARHNNAKDQITGALICRADLYMQMLEGPRKAVTDRFHRIMADDRHLDVVLISCRDCKTRLFPEWHMRDDPARSWMWTQAEVAAGAMDHASEADVLAVFARLIHDD
jgi:Sensors of blue-light using FAD